MPVIRVALNITHSRNAKAPTAADSAEWSDVEIPDKQPAVRDGLLTWKAAADEKGGNRQAPSWTINLYSSIMRTRKAAAEEKGRQPTSASKLRRMSAVSSAAEASSANTSHTLRTSASAGLPSCSCLGPGQQLFCQCSVGTNS